MTSERYERKEQSEKTPNKNNNKKAQKNKFFLSFSKGLSYFRSGESRCSCGLRREEHLSWTGRCSATNRPLPIIIKVKCDFNGTMLLSQLKSARTSGTSISLIAITVELAILDDIRSYLCCTPLHGSPPCPGASKARRCAFITSANMRKPLLSSPNLTRAFKLENMWSTTSRRSFSNNAN